MMAKYIYHVSDINVYLGKNAWGGKAPETFCTCVLHPVATMNHDFFSFANIGACSEELFVYASFLTFEQNSTF